jgi:hypothetical protein
MHMLALKQAQFIVYFLVPQQPSWEQHLLDAAAFLCAAALEVRGPESG